MPLRRTLLLGVALAVWSHGGTALAEPAKGTIRLQACRLMKYEEAMHQTLSEWWLAAGAEKDTVRRKLHYDKLAVSYFCEKDWHGKTLPDPNVVGELLNAQQDIDDALIVEQAAAGKLGMNDANRQEIAETLNEMTAHFLQMRMNGCGNLMNESGPGSIGNFLRGGNATGIDVFGNELASVPGSQILPVTGGSDTSFFDSRSICSGGAGGGGGGAGKTPSVGSAVGAASCYMDTTASQDHCEDGPAAAFDIGTATMLPSWLSMKGSNEAKPQEVKPGDSAKTERRMVSHSEHTRDTVALSVETAVWVVSVLASTGVAYTATGLVVVGTGGIVLLGVGAIGLAMSTWAHYDKYFGDGMDRVNVAPPGRMCPMFRSPDFFMYSAILKGQPLSGIDAFAGCADVQCVGVFGTKQLCLETQTRSNCQHDPQVFDEEQCVAVMQTDHEDSWNREALHSRFCSLATCSDGQDASFGAGGCECSGASKTTAGTPQLVYDPCWYSYCGEAYRAFLGTRIKKGAMRFVRQRLR